MSSESQRPDYKGVIEDLERDRDRLSAKLKELEAQVRQYASAVADADQHISYLKERVRLHQAQTDIAPVLFASEYDGMSIPVAAMKWLEKHGKPASPKEIADALEAAGYKHESTNFANTVGVRLNSVHKRNKAPGLVKRVVGQSVTYRWDAENAGGTSPDETDGDDEDLIG